MISRFHRQKVTAGNCWSGHHHQHHLLFLLLVNFPLLLPLFLLFNLLIPSFELPFTFSWSLSGPIPGNLNQLGQAEASLPSFPPFRFTFPPLNPHFSPSLSYLFFLLIHCSFSSSSYQPCPGIVVTFHPLTIDLKDPCVMCPASWTVNNIATQMFSQAGKCASIDTHPTFALSATLLYSLPSSATKITTIYTITTTRVPSDTIDRRRALVFVCLFLSICVFFL